MYMRNLSDKDVAGLLLSTDTIFFRPEEPFTWASGIKSPVYCDNRLVLGDTKTRDLLETAFAQLVASNFPGFDSLFGVATAGVPHAAIIAHLLNTPMGYVRAEAKDHGRENRIEGRLKAGERVVVIEDLISTGESAVEAVTALREAGATVLGVASIFTYGLAESTASFEKADIKAVSLTNLDAAALAAYNGGLLDKSGYDKLLRFRDNPRDDGWMK